jgi:hypothetical protein
MGTSNENTSKFLFQNSIVCGTVQSDNEGMDTAELSIDKIDVAQGQAIETLKSFSKKELFNVETGVTARINTKQRNKLVSNTALIKSLKNGFTAGQHNAAVANIDNIFKHATLIETSKDKNGDANILSIKRFATSVAFNGETAIAYLTLKESVAHGHRLYSLELMGTEKSPAKGNTLKERTTAGYTSLSPNPAEKSSEILKGITDPAEKELFQLSEEEIAGDAQNFNTWEEWRDAGTSILTRTVSLSRALSGANCSLIAAARR